MREFFSLKLAIFHFISLGGTTNNDTVLWKENLGGMNWVDNDAQNGIKLLKGVFAKMKGGIGLMR